MQIHTLRLRFSLVAGHWILILSCLRKIFGGNWSEAVPATGAEAFDIDGRRAEVLKT